MAQPPRRRARKEPEPLDWRSLADGPALRGLTEVLGTPVDVSRERAARRMAMEGGTPTVGVSPTVATAVTDSADGALTRQEPRDQDSVPPTVGGTTTVGDSPTVATAVTDSADGTLTRQELRDQDSVSPTVGGTPTVGASPTVATAVTDSADGTLTRQEPRDRVNASPTVGGPATVGVSPTVGASISLRWFSKNGAVPENCRILAVETAEDTLTLGEQHFYRVLWEAGEADGATSRIVSLGYDRLARLARLNEKSVRQLIPHLAEKHVLTIIGKEDSTLRQGKTYRVFAAGEILRRQKGAGMHFIVKRGRAVEFAWNLETSTVGETPTVG